jgi:hypothetical protein
MDIRASIRTSGYAHASGCSATYSRGSIGSISPVIAFENNTSINKINTDYNVGSNAGISSSADLNGKNGKNKRPQAYQDHNTKTGLWAAAFSFCSN